MSSMAQKIMGTGTSRDHLAYLQRPFMEARDAVHRRMDALGIPH